MSLKGIDISNWQAGINLSAIAGQVDFIIVKATEGVGFVDKSCDTFFQEAKRLGKKLGFYHFARTNNAIAEADFFYNNTKNYFGQAIPILDWEVDDSVAWVNQFVNRIHELSGVWPWVYANPWRFNQGTVNINCGRWVAGYPYAITDINYGLNYKLPSAYAINNGIVCAWQFTSSCRLPGYSGNLDANVFYGDADAWDAYCGIKQPEPEPIPEPVPEPVPEPDGYDKTKLPVSLQRFDDVDPDAWYVDSLDWAVSNGIMSGYSTNTFDPNGTLTRAQATCILANYSGVKTEHTFSDVTPGNYYYDAVEWAANNGIVNGMDDGTFDPDGACTREAFCAMLANMAGDADGVIWPVSMDGWSSVSAWARDAVAWAVEEGIICNTGSIRPADACTRAEAAAMLHNYSKR